VKHKKSIQFIAEALAARPAEPLVARDISNILANIYNHHVSAKTVSKVIIKIEDLHPEVTRIPHSPSEAALRGCRYSYTWTPRDPSIYSAAIYASVTPNV